MSRLEARHDLLTRHRREVVQELLHAVARFQVVDQGAERNARSDEDRRPPEDLRVDVNY